MASLVTMSMSATATTAVNTTVPTLMADVCVAALKDTYLMLTEWLATMLMNVIRTFRTRAVLILIVITLLVDLSVFAVVRCLVVVSGLAMNPTVAVIVPQLRRVMMIVELLVTNFLGTDTARVPAPALKSVRLMVLHV